MNTSITKAAEMVVAAIPEKNLISPQQLRQIEPNIIAGRANALAPILSIVCIKYGITTRLRLAAFLATIIEESGGFTRKEENLNYTTAARIVDVWPSRFSLDTAKLYTRNPEKLANKVYANRLGNGGPETGDGFKYRGLGYIQITGKTMHQAYQKYAGVDEEQMRRNEYYAVDSAAWYFVVYNTKVMALADKGDFDKVTVSVNGAKTNWDIRLKYYNRCLSVFK